jgi:hypothetical protein
MMGSFCVLAHEQVASRDIWELVQKYFSFSTVPQDKTINLQVLSICINRPYLKYLPLLTSQQS